MNPPVSEVFVLSDDEFKYLEIQFKTWQMNVVDVFAGCGGFSRGFREEGFELVVAVENFKPVAQTYEENFPEAEVIVRDVKEVRGEDISRICGDVDVLIGSPPCEPFTSANLRRAKRTADRLYRDRRGQLVLHFVRLVKELKPKVFVMENVPQILELKNSLIREFRKIGVYKVFFNVLKAQNYGNPSKRTRVFISNVPINEEKAKRYVKVWDALKDLMELNTLPNHEEIKVSRSKLEKISKLRWGESLVKFGGRFENWLRLHPYRLAPTVMGHSRFVHPFEDRLLTVREQARLMGFPDDHVFLGGKNVQFDMVGEAVPVPLARKVARDVKLRLKNT